MQTKKNFAINALLIFFSILVGNFCNFLFNFFLARFLSVESYGIYNVLASTIFAMVVIQTPVQNYIITVLSSNISNDKENNTFYYFLYHDFFLFLLRLSSIPIIVSLVTGFILQLPVIDCFFMVFSMFFVSFASMSFGIMQSFDDKKLIFLYNIFFILLKITFCLPAAFFTKSLTVTLLILLLVSFGGSLFFYQKTKVHFNACNNAGTYRIKDARSYILKSAFVYICFSLMQLQDVLIVKYFCSPYETGIYSSAAVIGKIIIYVPCAIVLALFPVVSGENASGKSSLSILLKAIVLNLIISTGGSVIIFFTAEWMIPFLFGQKYIEAVYIIKYLGLAFCPFSLIMILFTFYLAKNKFNCIHPMLCAVLSEFLISYFYHASLMQIIMTVFISGCIGCIAFFLLSVVECLISDKKHI